MSTTTTSASPLSAMPRATVAPTLPAPPTTVTFRFMSAPESPPRLHIRDDRVAELGGRELGGAGHQAGEIVRDPFRCDRAVHPLDDEIRRLGPPEVAQHHLSGQDHGSRIDLVQVR